MTSLSRTSKSQRLAAVLLTSVLTFISVWPLLTSAVPVGLRPRGMLPRRVAIFTTETDVGDQPCTAAVQDVLSHCRIGRMVFRGPIRGVLPLRSMRGGPLFSLVVICDGPGGLMSGRQRAELVEYQREFDVRRVTFAADPDKEPGMRAANAADRFCCEPGVEQLIKWFTPAILADADIHIEEEHLTLNPMSSADHRHIPAVIINNAAVKRVLSFEPLPGRFPVETMAAVVVRDDNVESLLFFFNMTLSETALRLGDMWIKWGLRTSKFVGYPSYATLAQLPSGRAA